MQKQFLRYLTWKVIKDGKENDKDYYIFKNRRVVD